MNPNERKKQTHLRCERQRREAINGGYTELKDLLPASASFVGCKTTNAAILFRAADYVKALNQSIEKSDDELSKLQTQHAALELILKQYEDLTLTTHPYTSLQAQMWRQADGKIQLQNFLDACFESFSAHVDTTTYSAFTRTLLMWIEQLDFSTPAEAMIAPIFRANR